MPATGSNDALRSAEDCLRSGKPQDAIRVLRFAALTDTLNGDDIGLRRLFDALSTAARQLSIDPLQQAAEAACTLQPQPLYDLGYQLIDLGLPQIAIPVLQRLNRDLPGQSAVVEELAAAFERSGHHEQARDLLLANPDLLDQFWHRYVLCFNALSAADVSTAIDHATRLQPSDGAQDRAMTRLRGMLARVRQVGTDLSLTDLRGWHFVMNGSILLHLSPYGFHEGMQGRYAYLHDSVNAIHQDLSRLVTTLEATGKCPKALRAFNDPGSQIIAGTLGCMLGIPVHPLEQADGAPIVTYDLSRHTPLALGPRITNGSAMLITRAASWTEPPLYIPSFVGLLHQVIVAPWNAQSHFGDDGTPCPQPVVHESADVWIERILDATESSAREEPASIDDPIDAVIQLARHVAEPSDIWFDGPVTSHRFS